MNTEYLLRMSHDMRYKLPSKLIASVYCIIFISVTMCTFCPEVTYAPNNGNLRIRCYGYIVNSESPVVEPENPWLGILRHVFIPLAVGTLSCVFGNLALDYLREMRQKWKDGEPKTPIVNRPSTCL